MDKANATHLALSDHLKQYTTTTHESLDQQIMHLQTFANRENYQRFLRMQLRLHAVTEPLYADSELNKILPGLAGRCRNGAITQDCYDLALPAEAVTQDLQTAATIKIPSQWHGLGWLYTHEGSTLGAAFLLKFAQKDLGLTENFGAHHLAAHSQGRGLHWRSFKKTLDNLDLSAEQRAQTLQGAQNAFAFVRKAVSEVMA